MTHEEYKLMLDASDSVYSNGLTHIPEGYALDKVFEDRNNNGFQAVAFRNITTGEAILAFAGTQDLQDAHADIKLGWDQWEEDTKNDIIDYINLLLDDIDVLQKFILLAIP